MTQETLAGSSIMDGNLENYIEISIPGEKVQRRRIIFNWLLAIPHLLFILLLGIVAVIFGLITLVAVLITGKIPRFSYSYVLGLVRYANRVWGFIVYFFPSYPKFRFKFDGAVDTSDYQLKTHFSENPDKVKRWRIFSLILVIPHMILSYFLGTARYALLGTAALYALVTGRYPDPIRAIMEALSTYDHRIVMYIFMISNKYPRLG